MIDPNFSTDQPFLVFFSVLDATVAEAGGAACITRMMGDRIKRLLNADGLTHDRRREREGETFALAAHAITIVLAEVERAHERAQWRIQLRSDPPWLTAPGTTRTMLLSLHETITQAIVAAPQTEDVDIARPG